MISSADLLKLSAQINPFAFIRYLRETDWNLFPRKREDIKIFQYEKNDDFFQITIPIDKELADYKETMLSAVKTVAKVENKSVEQLLLYLLNPNSDILKIRLDKKNIEAGNILFDDAIRMYENVKKLLGAAALDILHPRKYHQGRIDDSVSDFLSTCRFGQTEVGSYVLSIVCPFSQITPDKQYEQLSIFADEKDCADSFTRQVTNRIMSNIASIKKSIDDGDFDKLYTRKTSVISANFYEALAGLNLNSPDNNIEFIAEWSPTVKNDTSVNNRITLTNDYYQPIDLAIKKLKAHTNKATKIIGRIKQLESSPDISQRTMGKIVIVYLDEKNKPKTVRAKLDSLTYNKAIKAHEKGLYVEVIGKLSGKTRASITCEAFNIIE